MTNQKKEYLRQRLLDHPLPWRHGSSVADCDHEWIKDANGDVIATDICPDFNQIICSIVNYYGIYWFGDNGIQNIHTINWRHLKEQHELENDRAYRVLSMLLETDGLLLTKETQARWYRILDAALNDERHEAQQDILHTFEHLPADQKLRRR